MATSRPSGRVLSLHEKGVWDTRCWVGVKLRPRIGSTRLQVGLPEHRVCGAGREALGTIRLVAGAIKPASATLRGSGPWQPVDRLQTNSSAHFMTSFGSRAPENDVALSPWRQRGSGLSRQAAP